jgi:thiol-disulfide isomerase/thioredoxin
MFRNLCLLLFSFSSVCMHDVIGFAQSKVHGTAPEYKGEYLIVHRLSDVISNQRELVDKQLINEKGEFDLVLKESEIRLYYLSIGSQTASLYVEPNASYQVTFPPRDTKAFQRFDGSEVSLGFDQVNEHELNILIRRFNTFYIDFINLHYYDFAADTYTSHSGVKSQLKKNGKSVDLLEPTKGIDSLKHRPSVFPEVVEQFRMRVDSIFSMDYDQPFFKDYVDFSISEIELLAGLGRKYYYQLYFMSRSVPYHNPAFGSAFRLFYKNSFTNVSKEVQNRISKAVNLEHNSELLTAAFNQDTITTSTELRALMCLNGLRESVQGGTFLEPMIQATLDDYAAKNAKTPLGAAAAQLLLARKKFQPGWVIEDFTLVDLKGERWTWSQQESKPTYFLCFATWSASSLKELAMLQKLESEFGDAIKIVAISMDKDIELIKKYIQEHRDQRFQFLSGIADPLLVSKFNIRSIPHAVLVDEKGAIMYSYTRKPSEGVQMDFKKYMTLLKEQHKSGIKNWKGQ